MDLALANLSNCSEVGPGAAAREFSSATPTAHTAVLAGARLRCRVAIALSAAGVTAAALAWAVREARRYQRMVEAIRVSRLAFKQASTACSWSKPSPSSGQLPRKPRIAPPNGTVQAGAGPLHIFAAEGHVRGVKRLVAAGANVEQRGQVGRECQKTQACGSPPRRSVRELARSSCA